jgi:alkaline phosphatase
MISVSDHETGGFSVAHQIDSTYPEYQWYPEYLVPIQHSGEYIAKQVMAQNVLGRQVFLQNTVFKQWLGISNPKQADIQYLIDEKRTLTEIDYYVGKITSDLAQLGWATHGHSAVDVNLYAYGPRSNQLRGNHENTEIGDFIVDALNLDLGSITKRLNKQF